LDQFIQSGYFVDASLVVFRVERQNRLTGEEGDSGAGVVSVGGKKVSTVASVLANEVQSGVQVVDFRPDN
jgi:hypothetical protein